MTKQFNLFTQLDIRQATMNIFKHQFNEFDGGQTFEEVANMIEFTFDLDPGSFDESGVIEGLLSEDKIELYHEDEEGRETDDPNSKLLYRLGPNNKELC